MLWTIKNRPKALKDVFGNDLIKQYFYRAEEFPKAILLEGLFGSGKTTCAKIIAQMILCTGKKEQEKDACCECPSCKSIIDETWNMDCKMIDSGTDGKIDAIRNIVVPFISKPSLRGNHRKVIIIEEVQEMSKDALNALLKILEKPLDDVYFIFTSMQEMPESGFKSRCVSFSFEAASEHDIINGLTKVLDDNGYLTQDKNSDYWKPLLSVIASSCNGSYRQAIQLLQQLIEAGCEDKDTAVRLLKLVDKTTLYQFLDDLLNGRATKTVKFMLSKSCDHRTFFDNVFKIVLDACAYAIFGSTFNIPTREELAQIKKLIINGPALMKLKNDLVEVSKSWNTKLDYNRNNVVAVFMDSLLNEKNSK